MNLYDLPPQYLRILNVNIMIINFSPKPCNWDNISKIITTNTICLSFSIDYFWLIPKCTTCLDTTIIDDIIFFYLLPIY